MATGLAMLLMVACAVVTYACSVHQQWFAHSWPSRPGYGFAVALAFSGLWLLCRDMTFPVAVFTLLSLLMLLLSLMPLSAVLRHLARANKT